VLAITGLPFHDLVGTYTQQDVALDELFMNVAVFNERVMGPTHVENLVDLGVRTALCCRAVSHITFPVDIQEKEVSRRDRSQRNVPHHTARGEAEHSVLPDARDFDEAAAILDAKKVVILAGRGALHATDELEQAHGDSSRTHRKRLFWAKQRYQMIVRIPPVVLACFTNRTAVS
jgi:pyruvate dehydrogenase (quinone)